MRKLSKNTRELLSDLFYDYEIDTMVIKKNKYFIIERIIQYGWGHHVKWLLRRFRKSEITKIVKTSKNIDRKTANFWSIYFKFPKSEIIHYEQLPILENTYDPTFKFVKKM